MAPAKKTPTRRRKTALAKVSAEAIRRGNMGGSSRKRMLGEIGQTGLNQQGGRVYEEWLRQLDGLKGMRVYREMADNDPTVGAVLFATEMLLRNVPWLTEPFSDDPKHQDEAEFVESLREDMEHTWEDLISEVLSFLVYGFHVGEIVYKRRVGFQPEKPDMHSVHSDGLIGIRKIAPRAQESIYEWEFDESGTVTGVWQTPIAGWPSGNGFGRIFIPREKFLLFRTTSRRGNPEGRSALRNIYLPWFRKENLQQTEAIGVERDLAGIPHFELPSELLDPSADAAVRATLDEYRNIMENLRNDEQAGVITPLEYDEHGNPRYRFSLVSSPGTRTFDTTAIINRYDRQILQTLLADFIMLGANSAGSFALSSDKTRLFSTALGAWLKGIAAVFNRQLIPKVYRLNGWNPSECARWVPQDLEKQDIETWAAAVSSIASVGGLTLGSETDEDHVRSMLGFPAAQREE